MHIGKEIYIYMYILIFIYVYTLGWIGTHAYARTECIGERLDITYCLMTTTGKVVV